jgi:hypothetical protein
MPFDVPHGFEMHDVEGEAAIPVDVIAQEAPPPPPPPEPLPTAEKPEVDHAKDTNAPGASRLDAGATADAAFRDASADASPDSGVDAALLAVADAGGFDGALAIGDGGGGNGPRDPQAIVGAAGAIQADVVLVMLVVNAEVIRTNPVGARMGYLLRGLPQWDDFMSGTDIDPVRDTDWVMISGPSLINSAKDVVLIHYSASDAVVDRAINIVSKKYEHGGPIDAGVPGVKATRAKADRAERILLRAQPHVLAVVPPSVSEKVARQLVSTRVPPHIRAGEAVYLRVANPHHPMPEIPESVTELRLRVVPRSDDGADVFLEGDTKDADAAASAADAVRQIFRRHNDAITSLVTHGLLDHVEVTTDGALVKAHVIATRDHIETLMTLVGGFLGVEPPAPAPSDTQRR